MFYSWMANTMRRVVGFIFTGKGISASVAR